MPHADELERIYDAHAQAIFAFALNLTRNESDTRDVIQDLFRRLATRPELLREVRDERGFLLRMAHNLAIDLIRRRARERATEAIVAATGVLFAPVADPDESAFRQQLEAALAGLPEEQRAIVHLKLWEGMTFERIAETLAIPINTAASRYRYGLDKLRVRLRPIYEEIQ